MLDPEERPNPTLIQHMSSGLVRFGSGSYALSHNTYIAGQVKFLVTGVTTSSDHIPAASEPYSTSTISSPGEVRIYRGIPDVFARAGKIFHYPVPILAFSGPVDQYKVSLVGATILPIWLEYHPKTRTIQGLPTSNDAGGYNIKVTALRNILHKSSQVSTTFQLLVLNEDQNVNEWSSTKGQRFPTLDNFHLRGCTTDGSTVYTSVILQAKVNSLRASSRISLIASMAEYLRTDPLLLTLCPFRGMMNLKLKKIHILASDTGNTSSTDRETVEIYWPISCGSFGMLQELIQVLNHNVLSGHISQYLGWHISGWRIFRKENDMNLQRKHRQVLKFSPTPAMTPPKPTYLIRPGSTTLSQIFTQTFISNTDYSKLNPVTEEDRWDVQTRVPGIPTSNSIRTPERQQSSLFTSVQFQVSPSSFSGIVHAFSPPTSLTMTFVLATTKHFPVFMLPSKPVMSLDTQTTHVLLANSKMELMSLGFSVLESSSYFLLGASSFSIVQHSQQSPTPTVVTEFVTKGIQCIIPTTLISVTLTSSINIIQPELTEQFTITSSPNILSSSMSSLFDEITLLTALNMFNTPTLDKITPTVLATNQDHKAETSLAKTLHSYNTMASSKYLLPFPSLYSQSSIFSQELTSLLHTTPIHSSISVGITTAFLKNSSVSDDHVLRSLLFLSSSYASTLKMTKFQNDITDAFSSLSTIHLNTSLSEMYTATEDSSSFINSTMDDKSYSFESDTKVETILYLIGPLHLFSEDTQSYSNVSVLSSSLMLISQLTANTNMEQSVSTGILVTDVSSSMKITNEDLTFHSMDSMFWSSELASTDVESLFYVTQQIDMSPSPTVAFTNITDIQTTLVSHGSSEEITNTSYLLASNIFTISPSTPARLLGLSEPTSVYTIKPELIATNISLLSSDRKLSESILSSVKSGTMLSSQSQSFSHHNQVLLSSFDTQSAIFLTTTYNTDHLILTSIFSYSFETEIAKQIKQSHITSVSFQENLILSTHSMIPMYSLSRQENQSSWDSNTALNSSIDGLTLLQHSSLSTVDHTPYFYSVTKLILPSPMSVTPYSSVTTDPVLSTFTMSPTSPSPEFSFWSTVQDPLTSLELFRQVTNQFSEDDLISFLPSFVHLTPLINFTETLSSSVPSNELTMSFGLFKAYSDNLTMSIATSVTHDSLPSLMPSFSAESCCTSPHLCYRPNHYLRAYFIPLHQIYSIP
ncbi:uncharacterized protein [Heterodontus francisci]|uniref:uncharacterized protein n=1 Tax=Heterodontus francisci TaxID=7792 RepID=UPI00355ADE64